MEKKSGIGKASYSFRHGGTTTLAVVLLLALSLLPTCVSAQGYSGARYVIPPDVLKDGISLAGVKIPLDRKDVSDRVTDQLNYILMDRRAGMLRWFDRMAMFGRVVSKVLRDERMPSDLIYVACLMSGLNPNAQGSRGGVGWWLLGSDRNPNLPKTIRWVSSNGWDDRRDPVLSTRIACAVFRWLRGRAGARNWLLTLCAFVDGTDRVDKVVKKTPSLSYWDMVMPSASETIIPRLVALKIVDTHREFYGVNIKPPPPMRYDFLNRLKLRKELPLYLVARWCGTNPRSLWQLNPGVSPSSGVLPKPDRKSPSGFPFLRVPRGTAKQVREQLVKNGFISG